MKTLLLILLLALPLTADRVLTVTWDKYPSADTIVIYEVGKDGSKDRELGKVAIDPSNPALESVEVTVGDTATTLYAIARNSANFESDKSEPLPVPDKLPTPGKPRVKISMKMVEIQTSSNLKDWQPLAYVPLVTSSPARFIRAGITEITP